MIVFQTPDGMLHRYDILGYVVNGTMLITIGMMYWIDRHIKEMAKNKSATMASPPAASQ
jgi:hypothetical protein